MLADLSVASSWRGSKPLTVLRVCSLPLTDPVVWWSGGDVFARRPLKVACPPVDAAWNGDSE